MVSQVSDRVGLLRMAQSTDTWRFCGVTLVLARTPLASLITDSLKEADDNLERPYP